jgi:hypothetical protein
MMTGRAIITRVLSSAANPTACMATVVITRKQALRISKSIGECRERDRCSPFRLACSSSCSFGVQFASPQLVESILENFSIGRSNASAKHLEGRVRFEPKVEFSLAWRHLHQNPGVVD